MLASRPIALEPASCSIGAADVSEKEARQLALATPQITYLAIPGFTQTELA